MIHIGNNFYVDYTVKYYSAYIGLNKTVKTKSTYFCLLFYYGHRKLENTRVTRTGFFGAVPVPRPAFLPK